MMMINKNKCTGCYACCNICPNSCISMELDEEGFEFPKISMDACINCGACEKVCPINTISKDYTFKTKAYLGYSKDNEDKRKSMTGGICYLLGKSIIDAGGVVYGVVGNVAEKVYHKKASTLHELELFRGSKYLQSEVGMCFRDVKSELEKGIKVLFIGTGCQIAGIKNFVGDKFPLFYTVDLICHGVPSKRVLNSYFKELEEKYKSKVISMYRDKSAGWKPSHFTIVLQDGKTITFNGETDIFNRGYVSNIFQRRSCLCCQFAKLPRISDITVGDFFSKDKCKEYDPENSGLSLMTINSHKGEDLYSSIKKSLFSKEIRVEDAVKESEHIAKSPKDNIYRRSFLYLVNKKGYSFAAKFLLPKTFLGKNLRRIYGIVCLIMEKLYFKGR